MAKKWTIEEDQQLWETVERVVSQGGKIGEAINQFVLENPYRTYGGIQQRWSGLLADNRERFNEIKKASKKRSNGSDAIRLDSEIRRVQNSAEQLNRLTQQIQELVKQVTELQAANQRLAEEKRKIEEELKQAQDKLSLIDDYDGLVRALNNIRRKAADDLAEIENKFLLDKNGVVHPIRKDQEKTGV